MNLEDIKKLSEIFNNIAQPIATILAVVVANNIAKKETQEIVSRQRKTIAFLCFQSYHKNYGVQF